MRDQGGTVLVVSLVVLLVMTLVGITSMQTTLLEERMAGNLREHNLAFQAGEAGQQLALTYLESLTNAPVATPSGSQNIWVGCRLNDALGGCRLCDGDWLKGGADDGEDGDDSAAGIIVYGDGTLPGDGLGGVSAQPRLAIQDRYVPPLDLKKAEIGGGIHFYSVCSDGTGMNAKARALLLTTIGKVYQW
jgi:type IV pilus assembly protein PilX